MICEQCGCCCEYLGPVMFTGKKCSLFNVVTRQCNDYANRPAVCRVSNAIELGCNEEQLKRRCVLMRELKKSNLVVTAKELYSQNKEQRAMEIIQHALSVTKNPIVFFSGGKDSTAMLHMVRRIVPDIEVVYLFDKNMMHKNMYTFKLVSDLGLNMYTFPPSAVDYVQRDDYFEILHFFYINGFDWHTLYNGCVRYNPDKPFICAVKDLLKVPTITQYNHSWDCIFHGQKETESVHIIDHYKIKTPILPYGYGVMAMPLFDWTDEEVWSYIHKYNLPYQKDRYDGGNIDGTETGDARDDLNCDVIPTCFECIDFHNEGKDIICPQTKCSMQFQGKSQQQHQELMDLLHKKMSYIQEVA